MKSIEEKLLGQLYCFCTGGDDPGGSAGDFDDSYNQAMGYTDTLGGPGRSDDSGQARQTTAEERAAAPGYDSRIDQALNAGYTVDEIAQSGAFQGLTGGAAGLGTSAQDSRSTDLSSPSVSPVGRVVSETTLSPPTTMDALLQEAVKKQQAPRPSAPGDTGLGLGEVDIFDTAYPGGATPAQQVQAAAGIQQARSVVSPRQTPEEAALSGSMYVPPSRTVTPVTDFDGITMPTGPGIPKDVFEQDLTPRTKEEVEMAADRGYFNYQDLNKDGKVTDIERMVAAQAFGLVGRASDIGRRMSVGDPNAGLDYEGEAYGTPDAGRRQDDDQQVASPVTAPPVTDPCPQGYKLNPQTNACEYVGIELPRVTPYTGEPITQTTQYTGIGSLNPFVLQPSYTAPRTFSPLFNAG